MNKHSNTNWLEVNQQYLMAALKVVEGELTGYRHSIDNGYKKWTKQENSKIQRVLKETYEKMPAPAALNVITDVFHLTEFEKKVLLMCAGVELDSKFAELLSSVQGGPMGYFPTFSLALAAFNDAHWSALSPEGVLRYWRLIELDTQQAITKSPLRIDERILHYLTGTDHMDERLSGIVRSYFNNVSLVSSHEKLAKEIVNEITRKSQNTLPPAILLEGIDSNEKQEIASNACSQLGANLKIMPGFAIPNSLKEISDLQRIWNRESALGASVLFIDCDEFDSADLSRIHQIISFCENIHGPFFIGSRQWFPQFKRPKIIIEVNKPTKAEQLMLWKKSFNGKSKVKNDQLLKLSSQFNLNTNTIQQLSSEVLELESSNNNKKKISETEFNRILWRKACSHARPRLDDLAQRIIPSATWDELILPDFQKEALREMIMHVSQQSKVYGEWGFESKGSRGLGISALFAGESGTGKTMASEVIARELDLDLYKIDLSQVVNKYIGETEKNLKRIFDAAAEGGAILLFDEADALFGKRSEVKDSHDRYANIEVSYLLQRMEDYRGLAILTTNMKNALDKAFIRRIRFIIQFPFPDKEQREKIWQGIFPSKMPSVDLDYNKLAGLSLVGGNIRNIALNAAFIAANQGVKTSMSQILQAAKSEYVKMEKSMSTIESGMW